MYQGPLLEDSQTLSMRMMGKINSYETPFPIPTEHVVYADIFSRSFGFNV